MGRPLHAALVLVLLAAGAAGAAEPPLPGPGPRPRVAASDLRVAACAGCHPDEAAEWKGSLHRRAWVDPVFQQALRVEPLPFCRGCHAPESDPAREPTAAARDEGVSCLSCHVEGGHIVAPRPSGEALHAVLADRRLAGPDACAGCHQFDFPSGARQRVPQPMQDTVAEHARSALRDRPCQSCHMPEVTAPDGTRHRSHTFAVLADPALVRSAARVSARRDGGTLLITLAPAAAGHSFPTGDMFRRLEVRAFVDGQDDPVRSTLARSFVDRPRDPSGGDLTFERVEAVDTRLPPPGGAAVQVALPDVPASRAVRWQVVYQRMETPMAESFGVKQVLDEIVIAEGALAPATGGAP